MNANRTKVWLRNTEKCSDPESLPEQLKSYLVGIIRRRKQSLRLVTWKVMGRNVWTDIVNWRIKKLSNCVRSPLHALTTSKCGKVVTSMPCDKSLARLIAEISKCE